MDKSQYMSWDDVVVGASAPPHEYTVSAEDVEKYGNAVEDFNRWFYDDQAARADGFSGRVSHPSSAAVYLIAANAATNTKPNPPGRVHAKQYYEFHRPAKIGDRLTTIVTVVDKYIKRERRYSVQESAVTNQNGERVLTARNTIIWPF